MRTYPDDQYGQEDANRLGAEEWQLECLKRNPDYVCWGIHEDCMSDAGSGWTSPMSFPDWKAFNGFRLDELAELVNFYFAIERDSVECPVCQGECYNAETNKISLAFYDFDETGARWCDKITQDEVDMLIQNGRLRDFKDNPIAAAVNAAYNQNPIVHDAINRMMLIEHRAKRLGVWGICPECDGYGTVFTAPRPRLTLNLWIIHPRKGTSRGAEIENVEREDLPAALEFLRQGARRNAERFGKLE